MPRLRQSLAVLAACAAAAILATIGDRVAPFPNADAARASEDAFVFPGDLHDREFLPPLREPGRWTGYRARFAFENIPAGAAQVEVRARAHRSTVEVSSGSQLLGRLEPGEEMLRTAAPLSGSGALTVTLTTQPFVSGSGRRLGTLLGSVSVLHAPPAAPRWPWVLSLVAVALVAAIAALVSGLSSLEALAFSSGASFLVTTLLMPEGLLRSAYASLLSAQVAALAVGAAVFSRILQRFLPAIRRAAFATFFGAGSLLVVVSVHPMIVGLDAIFHVHKLAEVSAGNLRPLSLTQHDPPFRFPYGVSFQVLLTPFYRLGADPLVLLKTASSLSVFAATMALFLLLARRGPPALAGVTAMVSSLLPGTVAAFSNANYSNTFGQAAALFFFLWWMSEGSRGAALGAILLTLAGFSHLSVFLFCCALGLSMVGWRFDLVRSDPRRRVALLVGLGLASAYYLQFLPVILEQLGRLGEGAGSSGRATVLGSLWEQARRAMEVWGVPALVLGAIGLQKLEDPDEQAYWLAGAALAACATFTPLEVRYLYALNPVLAIAAVRGGRRLWSSGGWRRVVLVGLCLAQIAMGLLAIVRAVLYDWRA